jgi:hypothetical protein
MTADFAAVKRAIAVASRKTDIDAHIVWKTLQEQFRTVVFPAVHAGMATHNEAIDLANTLIDRIPEGIASDDDIRTFLREGLSDGHDAAEAAADFLKRSGPVLAAVAIRINLAEDAGGPKAPRGR